MTRRAWQAGADAGRAAAAPCPPPWTWRAGAVEQRLAAQAGSCRCVVFVCLTGLLLILAAGVEALAPFMYSMF